MLNQAMLTTKMIAAALVSVAPCFQRWRRYRRNVGLVLQNLADRGLQLNSDTRAAFGAAGVDHPATSNGFHANSEAVGFFAARDGRLVGTFHDCSRLDAID